MSKTFSAKWSAIFGRFKSFFRSFFTSDSLDKIVMTFYLKSHLFISSATSHPILRRSHHRSRHGNAPAPPMIIVFILVTYPVRAKRAAPPLTPFPPVPFRLRIPKSRLPALCFTQNPDSTFPPNIFTLRPYAPPPGRSSYNIAAWIALMCCPCRYVLTPACCLWARSSLTFKCRMMGWG